MGRGPRQPGHGYAEQLDPEPELSLKRDDPGRFAGLAGGSLALAVVLGVAMRAAFAGVPLVLGSFENLRHAHSHLGYYGVLFPLAWWAWCEDGPRPPGRVVTAGYGLAVLIATIGFAWQGYGPVAIAASTVVLLVWLGSAWRAAPALLSLRSWTGPASPAIIGSAVAIPMVAVTSQTDAALSTELVQLFLTLLLFGVIVPAALSHRRAAPPLAPLWTLATIGAALALGPWSAWPTQAATVLLGLQVATAGWRSPSPWDLRALWLGLGIGLGLVGLGVVPLSHGVAIAGLHYAILGPVLVSLGRPLCPRGPRWLCLLYDAAVLVLTAAVLLPALLPRTSGVPAFATAAVAGGIIAVLWLLAVVTKGGQAARDSGRGSA